MNSQPFTKARSTTFTEVLPYQEYLKTEGEWRDGLVAGNGEQGVVCSCAPYSETMVFQNMSFILPSAAPRHIPPEVSGELEEARHAVITGDDSWNVHGRKRTYLYCFHPGHRLRIETPRQELVGYSRETDYLTAEIVVRYQDATGGWERRTFTSREDNVTITKIVRSQQDGTIEDLCLSLDDLASLRLFGRTPWGDVGNRPEEGIQYKKVVDPHAGYLAQVAHYPVYVGSELAKGGYAGVTRVIAVGGRSRVVAGPDGGDGGNVGSPANPMIRIDGATAVYLVSKTGRTHEMGPLERFADSESYALLDQLLGDTDLVIKKHSGPEGFSYEHALAPHRLLHERLFGSVSFRLGPGSQETESNEDLLRQQRESEVLLDALVERAYAQGRFAMVCCAGHSAPRLCGLWTGEWNPGWNGAYTMDANVNIQVSGMNTGAVDEAAIGYIHFVLKQLADWEENAAKVYGMKDALLIPVNTDGDRAIMVEYDQDYPFQYWNAGASWVLLPIFEFWQCFGNRKVPRAPGSVSGSQEWDLLADVLLPTLTKASQFWEQLCDPRYFVDSEGTAHYRHDKTELGPDERYLIIPSYSPENKPKGYRSVITMNATMDVSAARDCLKMLITVLGALDLGGADEIPRWKRLMDRLPEYRYDETGALREWAVKGYEENNAHRHISHLYCAWPGYEVRGQRRLAEACAKAVENRNRENLGQDDTASHGWIHKALVSARLRDGESVYRSLFTLMSSQIFFPSLMTDHNTDRSVGVFCTDTSLGLVGVIHEALLYSDSGEIEALPALPPAWRRGSIHGLAARTNARVDLDWDLEKGVAVAVRSRVAQTLRISFGVGDGWFTSEGSGGVVSHQNGVTIDFAAGEERTFHASLGAGRTETMVTR